MSPPEPRADLLEIAGEIADAQEVSWGEVTRERPADERTLEGLKLLESVARTFRDRAVAPEPGPAADSTAGDWGHLRLLERLGEGSFGEVVRAYDPFLDREVALKLRRAGPSPEAAGGLAWLAEAKRLASVRHENVLTVHGADVVDGRVGLWTDLIEGRTLEELLADHGPLGPTEVVGIGSDLCRALAAVHAAGIVHGDVKTSNVMREVGGRIVLMDFGAADRIPAPGAAPSPLAAGTPVAMAPELLDGEPPTPATDVYATGVLLYRLLTGRYPVEAESLEELKTASAVRLADARPDLPSGLVDSIERALAAAPRERFATPGDLGRALRAAQPEAAPATETASWAPSSGRRRVVASLGVFAAVAALALAASWWRARSPVPAPAAGGRPSLAVLPLRGDADLDADSAAASPDEDYLATGMTHRLLAELGRFRGLRLIASGSVVRALAEDETPIAVGTRLGVDAVLFGSARRVGERTVVSLELVRPASEEVLWADRFERGLGDVFTLQREIARSVADAVHLELSDGGGGGPPASGLAVAPQIADDYFRARNLWRGRTREGVERSVELYRGILDRAPDFAPAWAGLADSYLILGAWSWLPADESSSLARAAARHALDLDPSQAGPHATLATLLAERDHDRLGALERFEIALELAPGSPDFRNWYAEHLAYLGRFDEALEQARIYAGQDPLSPLAMQLEGTILYYAGRFEEAAEKLERATLRHPENPFNDLYLALALTRAGRPAEGAAVLERARVRHPERLVLDVTLPGILLAAGREEEGRRLAADLVARHDEAGLAAFHRAHLATDLGDEDEALSWLERSYAARDWQLSFLAVEPIFAPLHRRSEFLDLLDRLGLALPAR